MMPSAWVRSDVVRLLFNFTFQVLLVGQDVPLPLCDGLILAHPDLLSHLKKGEAMPLNVFFFSSSKASLPTGLRRLPVELT